MGVYYNAYVILGLRVKDPRALVRSVLHKLGDHDYPQDVLFHPKTGAQLWKAYEVPVIDLPEGSEIQVYQPCPGYVDLSKDRFAIVGRSCGYATEGLSSRTPFDVKLLTEPHGLWDPDEFGIWPLLEVS